MSKKKIVVIGGGTGSSTLLKGLITLKDVSVTVVVGAFDDGGSGGKLRSQLGILPPGDPRVCLAATSAHEDFLNYRFQDGDLRGHTVGNIIIAGFAKTEGSMSKAMEKATVLFQSPITILPVTEEQSHLYAVLTNGKIVRGEDTISDDPPKSMLNVDVENIDINPSVEANPLVLTAIAEADLILIAPGDLYASCLANFLPRGIQEALATATAKKIYVCNLFTKWGHQRFTSTDFIATIQQYVKLDYAMVNMGTPSPSMIAHYEQYQQYPVQDTGDVEGVTIIRDNFLHETTHKQDKADTVLRQIIRHKYDAVVKHVQTLLKNGH